MPDQPSQAQQPTSADILSALERLVRHVEGLQRDVRLFAGRIVPFEDEKALDEPSPWLDEAIEWMKPNRFRKGLSAKDVYEAVIAIDRQLQGAERDVGYVKAQVEAIAKDAYLQADWKDWLKR